MADIPPLKLEIDGVEKTNVEWDITTEEVLGGTGRITVSIQDRTNSWEPLAGSDVKASIRATNWVLGRGQIVTPSFDLPVGMPWRTWKLDCSDANAQLPQRKVGALDGKTWIDEGGFGFFMNIDPYSSSLDTDKLTVQQLFAHYVRINSRAMETSTYVGQFLSDFRTIQWEYADVQKALNDMAALIVANLQFWIDPADFVHWVLIPAWQDLPTDLADLGSGLGLGFPEAAIDLLDIAPYQLTDNEASVNGTTIIGHQRLSITLDGSEMPEQVYVQGGTGYVYNAPALAPVAATKTVVKVPIAGTDATYQLTFLTSTKVWNLNASGYISAAFVTVGASGPFNVKYVNIPVDPASGRGGHFWKLLSGPNTGKLVDNDTNFFSYGSIRVEALTTTPGEPKVGIGGSGWVDEADQDPNKRQSYMQAPISVTRAMRDSYGGQAVARGTTPTLRGQVDVVGYDGWRAGQLMKVTDARLPANLNGRYFVIQRVKGSFLAETELRKYTLDFGDGPVSRWSGQPVLDDVVDWPSGAIQLNIDARDLSPGPNSTQIITGQLVNKLGEPWAVAGKAVEWRFECYNSLGVLQTTQGSITPLVSVTDKSGKARTRLTTGAGTALVYYMFARVKAV